MIGNSAVNDAPAIAGFGDEAPAPQPEQPPVPPDAMQAVAENTEMPDVLRLLAMHVGRLEHHQGDAAKLTQSVMALGANLDQVQKAVIHLSQQRAVAEVQIERQTR